VFIDTLVNVLDNKIKIFEKLYKAIGRI